MATKESQFNADKLISTLDEYLGKLPPLPTSAKDLIVKIAPWLALIFGVLGVLTAIGATGLLTVLSPLVALGGGVGLAAGSIVSALLAIVSSGLMVIAFPGLRDRKKNGWMMSFWSETVSVIASVVSFNLVGAIIGGLIGYYILFQIRSYYK